MTDWKSDTIAELRRRTSGERHYCKMAAMVVEKIIEDLSFSGGISIELNTFPSDRDYIINYKIKVGEVTYYLNVLSTINGVVDTEFLASKAGIVYFEAREIGSPGHVLAAIRNRL